MSSVLPPVGGGMLGDIFTWIRRIIKAPSEQTISTIVLGDYVNRFSAYDLPASVELFEFKRQYTFETVANIFEYQAPFFQATTSNFPANPNPPPFIENPLVPQAQTVLPVYQMFLNPIYCDGVQMGWYQSNDAFYKVFPELVLNEFPIQGNGTTGPYVTNVGRSPILRGFIDDLGNLLPYVYITTQDLNGSQQYVVDSSYLDSNGLGILIQTDSTFQNLIGSNNLVGTPPNSGGVGRVNYLTGEITINNFNDVVAPGINIETQVSPYSAGFPRICLFFNNVFKLYPVPDRAYKIQCDAHITPTFFFNTTASVPFAYMSEYIARGAARKILSDTGDWELFDRNEPLFREQENFVLRRSDRQRATQRTPTIFSAQQSQNPYLYSQY